MTFLSSHIFGGAALVAANSCAESSRMNSCADAFVGARTRFAEMSSAALSAGWAEESSVSSYYYYGRY